MNYIPPENPTVLVTGVGAVIGYGIVRSLKNLARAVRVVGMDIYPDAVGQKWCDVFEQTLPANHPDYPARVAEIIERNKIHLIIPGIEQDIFRLVEERDRVPLIGTNARFALNNPELIYVARDKWRMHQALLQAGFRAIPTWIEGEFEAIAAQAGLPFLLKPRRSYASKGIQQITSQADFSYWKTKLGDNFLVQQIVGTSDAEYTVAAFGLGGGKCGQQIAFRRRLSADGSTAKAASDLPAPLENVVARLVQQFQPVGPTNFQFRLHQGEFLLLEINPRISSSTSLRTAFGYNEAEMCLEYYLDGKMPRRRELRKGSAQRYIDDVVHYDGGTA